jgi:Protein of unknown function (DUF2961)/Papain family cysteine protease
MDRGVQTTTMQTFPEGSSRALGAFWSRVPGLVLTTLVLSMVRIASGAGDLPVSGDLRPLFDEYSLTRSLQRARPTCSVFTVVGALEFAVAKRQSHTPRLSVEFLNWAANQAGGDREDGGFFSDLWKGFAAYGICTAEDYPYAPKFDPSRMPPPAALADAKTRLGLGLRINWIKEWNVNTGLTEAHVAGIKRALASGWPVCAGCRWPKQEKWTDGVLQMCPADAVYDGHSVLLVGYRDDSSQPGGGVFIFRNTAGAGTDGLMPYEYALAYMNDAVWIDYAHRAKETVTFTTPGWLSRDPLGSLPALAAGRSHRISSNEQPKWNDANLDMTLLPPGKSVEMPLLEGPGVITHMWLTSHAGRVNELNALSLRIYWDGRKEPGVQVPLGEFFAVGQGKPASVESVPVQVSPTGALSCYWRMPFLKSARIVVSNDNPDRTAGLYWQVDWVELQSLPEGTPYFHACYRQEYPAVCGQDYVVADLEGSGFYLGTVMSVTLAQDGWWGEGDDFFYIDGETVPSLQGTGSEDYFNDAWGFRTRTGHWFGQPRWQGDLAGDSGVAYRWHILDPVNFGKSLKVAFEHKGNRAEDTEGFYLERPDFINSVAFWYQVGEPKRFSPLPGYPERSVPWQRHHLVRAFRQARASGKVKPRVDFAGMFGARPVLAWTNTVPGARLSFPFTISEAGRYAVRLTAVAAPEYGAYDIELDAKTVLERANFKAPDFDELDLGLGTHDFERGEHSLSFHALSVGGKRAGPMAAEMLNVLHLPPEATRAVKTHNEAHFIRLGIGRAVYAYRLAYGVLPDSLEALVKAGLMSARYLADENNLRLRSHRDGDFLIVESTGPEPWTYRWQGLDARR